MPKMPEPHVELEFSYINFNRFYIKIKNKTIFAECRRFGGLFGLIKRNSWKIKYFGTLDLIYFQEKNLPKTKLEAAALAASNLIILYSRELNPTLR